MTKTVLIPLAPPDVPDALKLLFVDDQPLIQKRYVDALTDRGFLVDTDSSLSSLGARLASDSYDGLLLDLRFPEGTALDRLPGLRARYPALAIVIVTGYASIPDAVECIRAGADDFVEKSDDFDGIARVLLRAIQARESALAPAETATDQPFRGDDALNRLATVAAFSDVAIVLSGETGSGKTRLARWIHDHGPRKHKPFVEVNCANLDGELLEAELFGHKKGAFTSADGHRDGLFATADGGTFFFDEIGSMPERTQARLLKVLEEGQFRPLGSDTERSSDFRIICATQVPLAELVESGSFRLDLFYRLAVLQIKVPPLRSRREEIPLLFAELLAETGLSEPLDEHICDIVQAHDWPGNVRELKNTAQRIAAIRPVFPDLTSAVKEAMRMRPPFPQALPQSGYGGSIADMERMMIETAMTELDGDMDQVAERLGISRATLYRKLKQYRAEN